MKVGIYGGSFNPPHIAHVLAVSYVLATQDLAHVLVVPTFSHPLGKALTPFAHRVAMCNAAFRDLRRVEVSEVESELGETSRTLYTLRALQTRHPDWAMRLIVGADILEERDRWFGWDEVVRLAPPIVLGRQGVEHPEAPFPLLPAVASRDLRARIARGDDVSALVPREALEYARGHGLYAP
ncbi:MAG: nicotinate-nicotinamide nucleotide adenylyltransferase [Polyangiales bacterium]